MGIWQRLGRVLRLTDSQPTLTQDNSVKKISIHVDEIGSSGIENYSGYYYEEYLSTLRGTAAADLWDKMRRSDPKIKMILSAIKNPIKSAHWDVQAADQDKKIHAEFIEQVLFEDLSWSQVLSEILTFLDFGFACFEVVHQVKLNDPTFGNYNGIKKLAWRSPRTIERWNLNPDGSLISVSQYAYGDLTRLVDIPGEFLLVFTHDKEGDNYEGISALRPCFGSWKRKNDFLKLLAIGMEKFAIPTPYMDVPEGKEGSQEFFNAKKVLEKYVAHQQQYILKPAGWALGFSQTNFDASKIRDAINQENVEMAHAFLENFLELGQSGSGSYAMSYDLSDFFLTGIEHVAKDICDVFNRILIPDLIKMNFGPQSEYPEMVVSGIKDKPGKELAEILKLLVDGKIITPDAELEENMREKYGLPKQVESELITTPVTPPPTSSNPQLVQLSEKPKTPKALMTLKTMELKDLMKQMLGDIGSIVIQDLMAKKKKSIPSQYLSLTSQIVPKGSRDYKSELTQFLTQVSYDAIQQAKKEIPGGNKVKLSERFTLADSFSSLPPALQKQIEAQIGLLTQFQMQDLLKAIFFQFNNSVQSTDSDDQIQADLEETLGKFLEGQSIEAGASNTISKTVNEGRSEFFFNEDVTDQIESFTFVNADPVSPICQDLEGTVFSKDDPNMGRYSPPLHHNCKSYLVPNLIGSNKEIDPQGLKPSKASLEKYITLSEPGSFAIAYIDVSKKVAFTQVDAVKLASTITNVGLSPQIEESEFSYRIHVVDQSLFKEGSLKTFEPLEGVQVYYGQSK